jgi:hypothetical protein
MDREASESVDGCRFYDAGPAVVEENGSEVGPAM